MSSLDATAIIMDAGNCLCSLCGKATAEVFCPCTRPETFLCMTCVIKHMMQNQTKAHSTMTLEKLALYTIPGLLDRLQRRTEALAQVREQALRSVRLVDQAIEEYATMVEKAICELREIMHRKIEEVNKMKGELILEVNAALAEVERSLAIDHPILETLYGPAFRQLIEAPTPFHLFTYQLQPSPPRLHTAFLFPQDKFGVISQNTLELHDIRSKQVATHKLPVFFGNGVASVMLDSDTLVLLGAETEPASVYSLRLASVEFTTLTSLITKRLGPGVTDIYGFIYVFGGYANPISLTTCEKINTADWSVSEVPSMHHPHAYFTPCRFKSVVYLVSGYTDSQRVMETFNPKSESFTDLKINLPSQAMLAKGSVAFIAMDELCLLTEERYIARWKIESDREFRVSEIGRAFYSCQQPIQVNSLIYIANHGELSKFDLDSFSLVS